MATIRYINGPLAGQSKAWAEVLPVLLSSQGTPSPTQVEEVGYYRRSSITDDDAFYEWIKATK